MKRGSAQDVEACASENNSPSSSMNNLDALANKNSDGSTSSILSVPCAGEKDRGALMDDREGGKKKELVQRGLKLLFCFFGLQFSYILWGMAQEQIMTKEYKGGKFKSSAFCVFGNRALALVISMGLVAYKRITVPAALIKEAPSYAYIPSSISNSLSSWAQYEALKYLSFPTQVLSKSCKIIPVMLVGIMINRKVYPFSEYAEAGLITLGVAIFTLMDKSPSSKGSGEDSAFGIMLIIFYLACDSFTSQWQSKVYKQYSIDQFQMMLGINIWSMLLTGISLAHSGEGIASLAFILEDPDAMWHTVVLSITSAIGQLFIFYTIKELGPVTFTIMMTTRQIFSLVFSCMLFSHPLHWLSWMGALIVFATVFNRIRRKGSD